MYLVSNLFNEGGPLFMYTNLIVLIIIIVLFVKALLASQTNQKFIDLIKHLSLFGLVWGFLGQIIGLIGAFDAIEAQGSVAPELLASGLKVALLSPAFGMVVFLIARLGLITLNSLKKENK